MLLLVVPTVVVAYVWARMKAPTALPYLIALFGFGLIWNCWVAWNSREFVVLVTPDGLLTIRAKRVTKRIPWNQITNIVAGHLPGTVRVIGPQQVTGRKTETIALGTPRLVREFVRTAEEAGQRARACNADTQRGLSELPVSASWLDRINDRMLRVAERSWIWGWTALLGATLKDWVVSLQERWTGPIRELPGMVDHESKESVRAKAASGGLDPALPFFYGLQPRWLSSDRLYRVYVSKEMLAGAYVAGQFHELRGVESQLPLGVPLLGSWFRRQIAQREARETLYDSLDPWKPSFLQQDSRNFQKRRLEVLQTCFRARRSLWTLSGTGIVDVRLLDNTSLRFILVGDQQPEEVLNLLKVFDPAIRVLDRRFRRP